MNILQPLEARAFVASDDDIEALVTQYMDAQDGVKHARGTYLSALIATTQTELGLPTRKTRSRRLEPLAADLIPAHVAALEGVHTRFYRIILARVRARPGITAPEVNSKTVFARSYKSVMRTWILSGKNIGSLAAGRIKRDELLLTKNVAKPLTRMPKLMRSIDRRVRLLAIDRKSRIQTAEALTALAADLLMEAGVKGMRTSVRAFKRHSPLNTPQGMFLPVMRSIQRTGAHIQ